MFSIKIQKSFVQKCIGNHLMPFSTQRPKTGIVLLNMGGPEHANQVHDYLRRIMTDRDMIQFPIMQDKVGSWIAQRRTAEVIQKYKEIGGGSPILKWTRIQGDLMCKRLDEISPETGPHKHYVGFRYVEPFTEDALMDFEKDGIKNMILFSQYPQYSCATSGSSLNAVYKFYKDRSIPKDLKISIIDRWGTHPLFIKSHAELIQAELNKLPEDKRKEAIILFSAHSIPLKTVNRGDSYPSEVGATVQLVMKELQNKNPYQLVWQSKVGPLPWLGPFTDDAIRQYVKQGYKTFVLVPIAFVNEHVETLHEMDIEFCEDLQKELGIEHIRRVPAPNDYPLFINALADIAKQHLKDGPPISKKFLTNCPHCTNPNCYKSKQWFRKMFSQ